MKSFASDNYASVHPEILRAIEKANEGHAIAYGADPWTEKLNEKVKELFGDNATAFPVFNGTGANVIALKALVKSYEAILCSQHAHIHMDECGAPERFLGVKLIDVPSRDAKLTPEQLSPFTKNYGNEHQVQARVLALTQSTERGTVYTLSELQKLAQFNKQNGIRSYMDGARFANAVAALKVTPREIVEAAGLDIFSVGGTKNGLLAGELIVVMNPTLADEMKYFRKQAMQLASKMRYLSAQFCRYFENDLWLENARHANEMAKYLEKELSSVSELSITEKVEVNALFVRTPRKIVQPLQAASPFYTWDEELCEQRWMCSFDTTPEDVDGFVKKIKSLL